MDSTIVDIRTLLDLKLLMSIKYILASVQRLFALLLTVHNVIVPLLLLLGNISGVVLLHF